MKRAKHIGRSWSPGIRLWLPGILLLFALPALAQNTFNGMLINTNNSLPVPYALIEVRETGQQMMTDSAGLFAIQLNKNLKKVTLTIRAIGCRAALTYPLSFEPLEKVYIDVAASQLEKLVIKGLTAREVVEKAVAAIPLNFETKSHFVFAFYREYEKLNATYQNLIEADPVIMNRLSLSKNKITATEAFAIKHIRRSRYKKPIDDFTQSDLKDVLVDDPVYHLEQSSLNPKLFNRYFFNFDTTQKTGDYVVS